MALATFRRRLPLRRDVLLLFAACVFPVHVWAIIGLLKELPAWILRLSTGEMVGVISYTLAFALFESVLFLLPLLLLILVLPRRWFGDDLVAQGTVLVALTTAWAIAAHYNDDVIRLWGMRQFAFWFVLYLVSLFVVGLAVHRYRRIERAIHTFVERLSLLSLIYVVIDLVAVIVVLIRNLG